MPTILPGQQTSHIGYAQALGGFHATRYAKSRGRPLTRLLSLNFSRLNLPEDQCAPLFRELRDRVSRAWKYADAIHGGLGSFDYVLAHENPGGRRNVHFAVHVPAVFIEWFDDLVRHRLAELVGRPLPPGTVDFVEIKTPGNMAKYILKGVDRQYVEHFHMENWASDQGIVTGRRFATSRSLGRTARRRNNWRRK